MRVPIDFLLLEADDWTAGMLVGELASFGIVHRVHDAAAALQLLRDARPLSIVVPGGVGLDVATYAVTQARTRRVLVHADAAPTREELNRAAELGATYLVRPAALPLLRSWAAAVHQTGEALVRARVGTWRRRYGLDDKDATLLTMFATANGRSTLERTRQSCIEQLLARTGDRTLSTAVARLHLEIAEQHVAAEKDDDDVREPERLRVVLDPEGETEAEGPRDHHQRRSTRAAG